MRYLILALFLTGCTTSADCDEWEFYRFASYGGQGYGIFTDGYDFKSIPMNKKESENYIEGEYYCL